MVDAPEPPDLPQGPELPESPELPTGPGSPTSTEPLFSGGLFKALFVVLFALALGGGAYALAGGGIDVDLPDLPDVPEVTNSVTELENTNLENTNLENTTIDGGSSEDAEPPDPFTTAAFAEALEAIKAEAGPGAKLQRLFVNDVQTQAIVQRGQEVESISVRADDGEVSHEEASITISGNATLDDFAFALDGVEPAAIDKMLSRSKELSGAADFEATVLSLERNLSAGLRPPEWTINAQGGGRNLTYRAAENGGNVEDVGGGGGEIPQAALDAQRLNECIASAEQDVEAIQRCFGEF